MPLLVEKPESLRPLFYPSKENLGTTQDLAGRKFASNSAQKDKVLKYFFMQNWAVTNQSNRDAAALPL